MLHQECERRFGISSPREVIRVIRSHVRRLADSTREQEREITRLRRNMAKIEQRIKDLARVAARDIRTLIIDGNNCCYQGNDFIGLAALIPMTEHLAMKYDVTVVFDATIRRLLRLGDDHLRVALPDVKVHVMASRIGADQTILDAAAQPTVWVVSNDRFGDYRDKAAVREQRVIRHEILRDRVLIHELGVNKAFDARSRT